MDAPGQKHLSLAARYRPQTFAAVAGQPLAATALSRAAAQDKVAPAYLLSGTRGVGKTTIARIFAKALNCERAPAAEPCNECAQCRHVTSGNHVDVKEIDAASNTGVEDVRALRETIGFVPMEGRYKIFIVDEAHMLSKSAFNALLKTLEEPPAHTVFIFATTEAHRFPATIISRCQHFVFRHLPEQAIYEHVVGILRKENVEFEEGAARLLARRAAGSVRDSLSLLDQALAVCGGALTAQAARDALGMAGPELFDNLLKAIGQRDIARVVEIAASLLASGVDLGFFTRELGGIWRNLFLYGQAGEKILPSLPNLTGDEKIFLKGHAPAFSVAHLHAAWQMTLESQRGIAQSPEPGAALELLLLNLALLPQLLPVGQAQTRPLAEEAAKRYETAAEAAAPPAPHPEVAAAPTAQVAAADNAQAQQGRDWQGFCEYCRAGAAPALFGLLRALRAQWSAQGIEITAPSEHMAEQLAKNRPLLEKALAEYNGGAAPPTTYLRPRAARARDDLRAECDNDPGVRLCQDILGGRITDCQDKTALLKE